MTAGNGNEAQPKGAGRRTGSGYEVWYAWGESRGCGITAKPSIRKWGVLYKSAAYAPTVVRLTPGDLLSALERRVRQKLAEGGERPVLTAQQESAEGIVGGG